MEVSAEKKVYFLSDFHLGAPDHQSAYYAKKRLFSFLESIRDRASAIFIVGDMFDFGTSTRGCTKGYVRLLGKLAEITDGGIPIHFFVVTTICGCEIIFRRAEHLVIF
jgi:UDP-2,3-diacylglucosamine hydrolase